MLTLFGPLDGIISCITVLLIEAYNRHNSVEGSGCVNLLLPSSNFVPFPEDFALSGLVDTEYICLGLK